MSPGRTHRRHCSSRVRFISATEPPRRKDGGIAEVEVRPQPGPDGVERQHGNGHAPEEPDELGLAGQVATAPEQGVGRELLLPEIADGLGRYGHASVGRYEHAARAIDETARRMRRHRADGLFDRVAAFDALCAAGVAGGGGEADAAGPDGVPRLEREL